MTEFLNPQQLVNQLNIKPGMRIADFGCGSGNITIILARLVGSDGDIIAIDVQKSALESVKSRADLENLSNIKLVRANLETANSSGLEDNSVDLVLLANILFQSPNQKAIIQEAERVVKENSCIVVVDWLKTKTPYQTSPKKIKQMVGLKFEKTILAGDYHFGLVFRKA
ncbi:MAG: class I SAM-dependent methyltransferase [bacterium]